jgi:hypothetical protein
MTAYKRYMLDMYGVGTRLHIRFGWSSPAPTGPLLAMDLPSGVAPLFSLGLPEGGGQVEAFVGSDGSLVMQCLSQQDPPATGLVPVVLKVRIGQGIRGCKPNYNCARILSLSSPLGRIRVFDSAARWGANLDNCGSDASHH